MPELGDLIKSKRLARKWSLKRLGAELDVTPAYVADIEANRRQPSQELKARLSTVLSIPAEELAAADNRLSPDLREWIEERPEVGGLLRSLRALPDADMLIKRLQKIFGRRALPAPAGGFLVTWESELRAIAAETSAWSVETGGDLFGRWQDVPTIFLATKAGPNAQRDNAHFRLDVQYLRELSESVANDWSLRYFGDWHSHHRLGLAAPSGGDRKRILSIAGRNQFIGMVEIIATLEDSRGTPTVRIHPWLYDFSGRNNDPLPMRVKVLPGLSPVRQALIAQETRPEQDFNGWKKIPLHRIRIGTETAPPTLEASFDVDTITREKTLSQFAAALQQASGHAVEHHPTGFGCVVVAELKKPHYLAFALGAAWPMPVLEVDRLNRNLGSSDPIQTPEGLSALDVARLIEIFNAEKQLQEGENNV